MDKWSKSARFQYPADAYTLIALLKAEDIECLFRNEHSAQILSYMDVWSPSGSIEKDLPRAMEIMEEERYLPFSEGEVDPIVRIPVGCQKYLFSETILLVLKWLFHSSYSFGP